MTNSILPNIDYKSLLLSFIGSLTFCNHMGDVSNEIVDVLDTLDIKGDWDELSGLALILHKMGVTTLHGSPLHYDD